MISTLKKIKRKTRVRTRARALIAKARTALYIFKTDGHVGLSMHIKGAVKKRVHKFETHAVAKATDILFVSINDPLLDRYRTDHMVEGLRSVGVSVDKIYYFDLTPEHAKRYTTFIFYRCPWLPQFEDFFRVAREHNKVLIHTVDDLVIDTKYTSDIPAIQALDVDERAFYDEGVDRHKKTMEYCDYSITTTQDLATELGNYKNLKKIFVNRNSMSDEMVYWADKAIEEVVPEEDRVVIGYFSGTSTHNEDFQLVAPALIRILEKYKNVYIKLAGRIDAPDELKSYKDRLLFTPYVDWRKLPFELRKCHIVLAPLVDTVFNRAKSEIKWTEAALVGVPVVASDMGSFREVINDQETGVLADNNADTWYHAINSLISDRSLYNKIAKKSRQQVLSNHRTTGSNATALKEFIDSVTPTVIGFAGVNFGAPSGGNIVIKKHMDILRKAGYVVYGIESMEYQDDDEWLVSNREDDKKYDIFRIASRRKKDKVNLSLSFDRLVATFWSSVDVVDGYRYMKPGSEKLYLVQGMEANFYDKKHPARIESLSTYVNHRVTPITISKWCRHWLRDDFGREAKYAPNGIDISQFDFKERDWSGRKIKVLVEGDSSSSHKKVDNSFLITNKLDKNKYEISYLSNNAGPKEWYRVDETYLRIAPSEVASIYASHDILVKSSEEESFSYPPLEIMATGGVPVIAKNGGNAEYVVDGENAIYYKVGDADDAVSRINDLASNTDLFKRIALRARKTAEARDWTAIEKDILSLYK